MKKTLPKKNAKKTTKPLDLSLCKQVTGGGGTKKDFGYSFPSDGPAPQG